MRSTVGDDGHNATLQNIVYVNDQLPIRAPHIFDDVNVTQLSPNTKHSLESQALGRQTHALALGTHNATTESVTYAVMRVVWMVVRTNAFRWKEWGSSPSSDRSDSGRGKFFHFLYWFGGSRAGILIAGDLRLRRPMFAGCSPYMGY